MKPYDPNEQAAKSATRADYLKYRADTKARIKRQGRKAARQAANKEIESGVWRHFLDVGEPT